MTCNVLPSTSSRLVGGVDTESPPAFVGNNAGDASTRVALGWPRARVTWLTLLALFAISGCGDDGGPKPPATVAPSPAGSQGSNTAGNTAAGVAGASQAGAEAPPLDASMPMPPNPLDAGMPVATDAMVHVEDEDAGPWVPPDPTCADGFWRLAPGFLVARRVDYIADRDNPWMDGGLQPTPSRVISAAGMPCANATDFARCQDSLNAINQNGRHLITTANDNVRLWTGQSVRTIFGLVDTPSEAMWIASSNSPYVAPCTAKISPIDGGYEIDGLQPVPGCYSSVDPPLVSVTIKSTEVFVHEKPMLDGSISPCGTL